MMKLIASKKKKNDGRMEQDARFKEIVMESISR